MKKRKQKKIGGRSKKQDSAKSCLPFGPNRPLSWSAMAAFAYDKEKWYQKYILGEREPSSPAMDFGNEIGRCLAYTPEFMPEVPRLPLFEKKLTAKIGDIYLVGYLDSFDPDTKAMLEYKTSSNKKKWTQKSAQDHGQILFYMFLIWKNYGVPPEMVKCSLIYIPVIESGDFTLKISQEPIKIFPVKHTTVEVLKFAAYIREVYMEMENYVEQKS